MNEKGKGRLESLPHIELSHADVAEANCSGSSLQTDAAGSSGQAGKLFQVRLQIVEVGGFQRQQAVD